MNRPLRVFLCHSSNDKPAVRELYQKLRAEPWIQPWLDEEELFPGMDWNMEIEKAIEATDVILVCLSNNSITKEGYVQREIRIALDYADYKPEGTLFIIPVRLEECTPPKRLTRWQYADWFGGQKAQGLKRLFTSLKNRAQSLKIYLEEKLPQKNESDLFDQLDILFSQNQNQEIARPTNIDYQIIRNKLTLSNGMELMRVPAGKFLMGSTKENKSAFDGERPQHTVDIPYDYWMARFPVTNELFNAYAKSKGIKHPVDGWEKKKDHPVVSVKWADAMAYCQWLNSLLKGELHSGLVLRLPTEAEWEKAARGTDGLEYPWGNTFDKNKCNTIEGGKGGTTPVGLYSPQGDSPYGCADMSGNIWEWTHSLMKAYPYNGKDGREDEKASDARVLRGGSFDDGYEHNAHCASRVGFRIRYILRSGGFRVVASPVLF